MKISINSINIYLPKCIFTNVVAISTIAYIIRKNARINVRTKHLKPLFQSVKNIEKNYTILEIKNNNLFLEVTV